MDYLRLPIEAVNSRVLGCLCSKESCLDISSPTHMDGNQGIVGVFAVVANDMESGGSNKLNKSTNF